MERGIVMARQTYRTNESLRQFMIDWVVRYHDVKSEEGYSDTERMTIYRDIFDKVSRMPDSKLLEEFIFAYGKLMDDYIANM